METIRISFVQEEPARIDSPGKLDPETIGDLTFEIAGIGEMPGYWSGL